jgi:hypothetical protein
MTTTAPLARRYPIPAPEADDRFTFGLFLDVAKALEAHGYPPLSGLDLVDLGQSLYRLLYTTQDTDTAKRAEHLAEVAADDAAMAQGAGMDAAVESTGHMPGYYDNGPWPLPGEDDAQAEEIAAERDFYRREEAAEAERAEWREMNTGNGGAS